VWLGSPRACGVSGIRSRLTTLVALAVGAAPGFLLPVVITWKLPVVSGAALILAVSLTQIAYNAIAAAHETTVLVNLGRLYGADAQVSRISFGPLMSRAVTRVGPVLLGSATVLVLAAGLLSPDISIGLLFLLYLPLLAGLILQVATTSLSAYLYVSRRLPSVYVANVFLGGPSVICVLVWQDPFVVSIVYAAGQALRWAFLSWRVQATQRGAAVADDAVVESPTWRELSPQVVSSAAGQAMPVLVQALLTIAGAEAVAIGAIALRVWGAAWQVGVSTLAMPETVTLTRRLSEFRSAARTRWLDRRAMHLAAATLGVTGLGVGAVWLVAFAFADDLPAAIASGLLWSIVALLGLPGGMLGFWAGRGLVAVRAGVWLPLMIVIAFIVGALVCLLTVPTLGGLGALVAQACAFTAQGVATYWMFRRMAAQEQD